MFKQNAFSNSPLLKKRLLLWLRFVIILIAVLFALFPVIWIISAAFNASGTLATQKLIPNQISLANFQKMVNDPLHPFIRWTWNSIKVSIITSVLSVAITTFSAYAFSRFRFRLRRSLLMSILLVQVFPPVLAMIAVFLLVQQIGMYLPGFGLNTHGGLILIYLGGQMGINVWLMKGFFDSIPRDIDESAMVDGATYWESFWYLIFPLVRPMLVVVGILVFVGTFGDFVLARVILQDTQKFTLMVGLYMFISDRFSQNWGVFAAGSLLGSLPIVVLYLSLQDQIVSGLTKGAVKG
ncbi:MAG: maltose ABC transporter permease [Anaerolineaceae bacterium]|nr:maltose ABC transporter permease [Anaerolineaceae bacterium]